MFEGVVSQVLAGYLGRYVKGIQKEQLKIGIWNEEILLEKVDLILEAFDHLQLPFALKEGQVGKLSIKIPWKRLGWDSINIVLEDVFICACRRDDNEWTSELVEKREIAAKMARLNAAELAKFSKRVCNNQAGQSFISYVSAKILDNIQVQIQNVHIVYVDMDIEQGPQERFILGLKLSSLTVKTDSQKQNLGGLCSGKSKAGQVSKMIEIANLGIYCNLVQEHQSSKYADDQWSSVLSSHVNSDDDKNDYLVSPFNLAISLLVNKSSRLDGSPQYTVTAQLTSLVVLLNNNQLWKIMSLIDHFSTCKLKEKYGRYQPIEKSRSSFGWQRRWWHYAQESVLSDVRQRLRRTSWSRMGAQIICRRKYVDLYKRKLELVQQAQAVDVGILQELEDLDKTCDVEDILTYRSIAEKQLQEFHLNTKSPDAEDGHASDSHEEVKNDVPASSKAQGWLNWLSLGMLGAGGTADTSSFSGVVSDEIIKDIYEATEFHPLHSPDAETIEREKSCLFSIRLSVHQVLLTTTCMKRHKDIARALLDEVNVECKLCGDVTTTIASVSSLEIVNPSSRNCVIASRKEIVEVSLMRWQSPFIQIQQKMHSEKQEVDISVSFEPLEIVYDLDFLLNLLDFHHMFVSFQFHRDRVLSSLNGFEDAKTRLLAKADYVLSTHRKFTWDATFKNILVRIPWENSNLEPLSLVLEFKKLFVRSRPQILSEGFLDYSITDILPTSPLPFQLHDLYDDFQMELADLQGYIVGPKSVHGASIIEKFNTLAYVGLCLLSDEPLLRQMEVKCIVKSGCVLLSPFICITLADLLILLKKQVQERHYSLHEDESPKEDRFGGATLFQYFLFMKMECFTFKMKLEDDEKHGSTFHVCLKDITTRYSSQLLLKFAFFFNMIEAEICTSEGDLESRLVCCSNSGFPIKPLNIDEASFDVSSPRMFIDETGSGKECLGLYYESEGSSSSLYNKFNLWIDDIDLHIHPIVFKLLQQCYDKLHGHFLSLSECLNSEKQETKLESIGDLVFGTNPLKHAFSNYLDAKSTSPSIITLDQFPFLTVENPSILSGLDSSFTLNVPALESLTIKSFQSSGSQKSNFRKKSRFFNFSTLPSSLSSMPQYHSQSSSYVRFLVMDVHLSGIRIYFHDSSCTLGTISLPMCNSFLSFQGVDCWELLCSSGGLSMSSCWSPNVQEIIGPAMPNVSQILNMRVRRHKVEANVPVTEVCVGIQHLSCTLTSEYLAMIIGYFALPDWSSKNTECTEKNSEVRPLDLVYKFEILGSVLNLPLEGHSAYTLRLCLPLVFCSYIPESHSSNTLKNIPQEDVLAYMVVDRLDILNVFCHCISLLLLVKDDKQSSGFAETAIIKKVTLIEKLHSAFWIRIPCPAGHLAQQSSDPIVFVMKSENCCFLIEDVEFVRGLEAIRDAIDQFSSISKESQCFKSDVLQFLQLRRSLREGLANSIDSTSGNLTKIKMFIQVLSVKLNNAVNIIGPPEVVAEIGMQVALTASSKDGILIHLDVFMSGLTLNSFDRDVLLLASKYKDSGNIWVNVTQSAQGEIKFLFAVPSVDVWLYLSEWSRIIDLLHSYMQLSDSSLDSYGDIPLASSASSPKQVSEVTTRLTVKSEDLSVSVHLPLISKTDSIPKCTKTGSRKLEHHAYKESTYLLEPSYCKFVKFTLKSNQIELISTGDYMKLRCNIKKIRAILELMDGSEVVSLPFILISEVHIASEFLKQQQQFEKITSDIKASSLEVGLSHDVFKFWHQIEFSKSEAPSAELCLPAIQFSVGLRKGFIVLSDGKWSCNGPILEILMIKASIRAHKFEHNMEVSATCKLSVNYNNVHKVMWEAFIEPWTFQLMIVGKHKHLFLNSNIVDISLKSEDQLNVNITEHLIEAMSRLVQIFDGARNSNEDCELHNGHTMLPLGSNNNLYTKRHAPYILCNDTSLPLLFWVSRGGVGESYLNYSRNEAKSLQPGSSIPIYVEETSDDQLLRKKMSYSSEKLLSDAKSRGPHHMISIQIDGTSRPSRPLSMDLVGVSYFEVNFSESMESTNADLDGIPHDSTFSKKTEKGLVVPIVFDVSIHCYSKCIRLYSTVILFNASSMPLELRFDIPFGITPKILDPILPLQEFPLPAHLAEAGQMRWRPVGSDYLWSDSYSLSNLLSKENKSGFLRSFVCYPSRPTSYPFRCCISVENSSISSGGVSSKSADRQTLNQEMSNRCLIHQVKLTTPFFIRSYLPVALSLTIDSGGISHCLSLSEDNAASVFHIDSTHDLRLTVHMKGFVPSILKFSRAELFAVIAKLDGHKYSLSETLPISPDTSSGPLFISVEKTMDAFCGARELSLSVPFLLHNCTGISLAIMDVDPDRKGHICVIPPCYDLIVQEQFYYEENGLASISSCSSDSSTAPKTRNSANIFPGKIAISPEKGCNQQPNIFSRRSILSSSSPRSPAGVSVNGQGTQQMAFPCGSISSNYCRTMIATDLEKYQDRNKVQACMYSPLDRLPVTELMVRLRAYSQSFSEIDQKVIWSNLFSLVPASGSINVSIPRPCTTGAFLLSVTSTPSEDLSGRSKSVIFQPRFVICNACSRDLSYKQKGTNLVYRLRVGQHSHLHCSDKTRELLISIRFNEPGSQWSGSFLPDCIGDAQVKMRNYVSGALDMVRIEVQNACVSNSDEKAIGASTSTSGTQLILLSDDNTGFMPYRIDNFSMERLRIYQQRCELFETVVHSYTSCQYAWDEPCYPHRLVIEVPGERILGAYSFDDVRDCIPVCLPQTAERPERRLLIGVHAEGATKVLSIIDSNYHSLEDIKEASVLGFKRNHINTETFIDFTERMTIQLSFIGMSLINSSPQELVFACAKDTTIALLQTMDQQKVSIRISSIQIDNQLRGTPYPIMLSFDCENKDKFLDHLRTESSQRMQDENVESNIFDAKHESVLHVAAAKWRSQDSSLVSFEYVNISVAPLHVDLEEQVFLHLLDFQKTISSRLQWRASPVQNSDLQNIGCFNGVYNCAVNFRDYKCRTPNSLLIPLENPKYLKRSESHPFLPSVVPIGAPWQHIFLLARKKKKVYVELFELAPVKLTVSFSSSPWITRNPSSKEKESLLRSSGTKFQRGLMALVDVEGVPVHLGELTLTHLMASFESIEEILTKHYTRQLLHEMYKIVGSAGVFGNPIGFARNVGLGIKDFFSVTGRGIIQSPSELIVSMAQGSKSLVRNTVYAVSSATTQFSKAAHKGIVAFAFDEQAVAKLEQQRRGLDSHGKGVLNVFLEGLTELLQSPIRGAEEHGLPGVISGIALGTAGIVAKPMASILEATGKTAQSIRNRSNPHQFKRYRVRLPRPVARDRPLLPYSWEEAIGVSALLELDNGRLKDEVFVICRQLKQSGRFTVITSRLALVLSCPSLVRLGSTEFLGIADPEWIIEMEMGLESVVHVDRLEDVVSVVGSITETTVKHKAFSRPKQWTPRTSVFLSLMSLEFPSNNRAEEVLQVLHSTIEQGEMKRWGVHVLHRSNIR